MFKTLLTRTLAGAVFAIVILGSVFWHPYALAIVLFFIAAIGLEEFYSLLNKAGLYKRSLTDSFLGMLVYSLITAISFGWISAAALLVLLPLSFSLFIIELYKKNTLPFTQIGLQLMGVFYVALPFSLYHFVHQFPVGGNETFNPWLLAGLFILIWTNDTFAYLFGSLFGKRRLFERISPKKSWEGTIGGIVTALGMGWILGTYTHTLDVKSWLIIAAILIPAAIFGDLVESLFKRSLNVKDSGKIMPGHGGVLDRFDASNFALPFIVFYLYLLA